MTGGELRTKFIKPTVVGARVRAVVRVRTFVELPDARRYELDVWTEDDDGTKLTDGDAAVQLAAAV